MSNLAEIEYYKLLGVSRRATREDIDKAFKDIIRRCRIDQVPSREEVEEQGYLNDSEVTQLARAYYTLSDDRLRERYDERISRLKSWDGDPMLLGEIGSQPFDTLRERQRKVPTAFGRFGIESQNLEADVSLIEDPLSMADVLAARRSFLGKLFRMRRARF